MKKILIILLLWSSNGYAQAQLNEDSLRAIINQHRGDKAEVDALAYLGYLQQQSDSIIWYAKEVQVLARKSKYRKGEADGILLIRRSYDQQGNFSQAIQSALDALAIYEDIRDYVGMTSAHAVLQAIYREIGDYHKSLSHAFLGLQIAEEHNVNGSLIFPGHRWAPLLLAEIGQTYVLMNYLDSALVYTKKSITQNELFNGTPWEFPIYLLATILNMKGEYRPALEKYREALVLCVPNGNPWDTLQVYSGMSTLFKNRRQYDSTIHYAQIVSQGWKSQSEFKNLLEATSNLAQAYKAIGNKDSTLRYTEFSYAMKDSLFSAEKDREVQRIAFDAKLKEEAIKAEQIRYKSRVQLFVLIAGLLVLLLISAILWRNNRQKQKAKAKIEQAYAELKATQAQLIQREKMASLGELTAGVAHEIQNPLNFVNNFSEANTELIGELEEEAGKGNLAEIIALVKTINENEQKINQHGKRADAIVKSMLQHSRTPTGEKQPTDINALADEYLRLSYQAIRSKDKDFQVMIKTQFDKSIDKIEIIPQGMGRVLLNLFNNAFYALQQKKKQFNGNFEPLLQIETRKQAGKVEIVVRDNGTGIPEKMLSKIYQPFFTTKPAGVGTGLGLSLSYDIITKAHGGEMRVESKEGEYAAFIISLPYEPINTPYEVAPA
jgi:signal transduction histidine kinase